MRLGDHGRTVIMAVPPTARAMSGVHKQHDPVDVKSLGDAIHFAAHQCARAESVRGGETVVRRAAMPSRGWLEPSARSDSGKSRGGFSEQTHGRAGYFEVVGGVVIVAALGRDDSDCYRHAVGLDVDHACVATVDRAGGQDGLTWPLGLAS